MTSRCCDERFNEDLPDSIRKGQRITGMVASQARSWRCSRASGVSARRGSSGTVLSELLPHTSGIADEICVVALAVTPRRSITTRRSRFSRPGASFPGRPSMGAWVDYGLGRINENLPSFVVLISVNKASTPARRSSRASGAAGFLPSAHQGVRFRCGGDPVLYLRTRPASTRRRRRRCSTARPSSTGRTAREAGDPEIETRIAQAEMAFRMQTSVPDLIDLAGEPRARPRACYGEDVRKQPAPLRATACSRGGSPSAACASSSSITAAGTTTATCRAPARAAEDTDQAARGAGRAT